MKFTLFYIMISILPYIQSNATNVQFIRDYFLHQGINQLAVFACWNIVDRIDFIRKTMQLDVRVSYLATQFRETDMTVFLKVNYYKLGIFLDLDCPGSSNVLHRFTSNHLPFNESYFWLLSKSSSEFPYETVQLLPLSINAELVVALQTQRNSLILYDVYNPSYRHGGKLNVTYMGSWNPEKGLIVELTQYKYKRRGNLYGMYLNFSIVVDYPPKLVDMETYLTTPIDRYLDTMHRYNYALTRQLRDYYNFTMNLLRGTTWGYKVNGTFNGILGDMVKGIVDVGATPFRFKAERIDVLEFTVQAWVASPTIVLRHPKKNELSNQFFKPFSREIWWLTTVVAFINWSLLYLTVKIEQYYDNKEPVIPIDTIPASECALITTAALCQQGLSDGPRLYSGRVVFIFLFLWALMLYQFYSASIVGSLLAVPPRFITTPEALLESSLGLGAEDIAYNYDYFATDPKPVVAKLNRQKIMPNKHRKKAQYFTPEEGLKKVQRGGFAFQVDVATAYKIIEDTFNDDEICDLQEIRLVGAQHTATGTAKHSPFKKMVTYGLRQMVEKGLSKRLRAIWHHRRPECPEGHSSLPTPVALEEFSPVLFMFAYGIAIAIFVMLAENLIQKHWENFRSKRKRILSVTLSSHEQKVSVVPIFNTRW